MNVLIGKIIKTALATLPYFDRPAGLVQTVTKEDTNGQGPKGRLIRFPVEVDLENKNLTPMLPNGNIKGMFYIEDGGVRPNGGQDFTSSLTLVCWFNPKKIAKETSNVGINAMADIIELLKGYFNEAPIVRLKFNIESLPKRSSEIFAEYNYNQTDTQYLMPPYDFFAVKLSATYRLSKSCLTPLTGPEQC